MKNQIMQKYIFFIIFSIFLVITNAQNIDCYSAQHIPDVENYCSNQHEFNNTGVGSSGTIKSSCWPNEANDLWFTFTPTKLAFNVQLFAEGQDGNLQNPSMTIYSGSCGNLTEVLCGSVLSGLNEIELAETDIVIGQLYYIRIDARDGHTGSFKLCINSFVPVPVPQADCRNGVVLCNKEPFSVESILGIGEDKNEIEPGNCIEQEFASVWYKWTCDQSGTLDFDLIPNNPSDDLDFVVYRLPNGIDDCTGKINERCMASGEYVGAGEVVNSPCVGATGLRPSSTDVSEDPGCLGNSDNYIKSLNMVSGVSYALIVNNFSKSSFGFNINFGGTGTFLGPQADFGAEAIDEDFVCDKRIKFTNLSGSATDDIVSYTWRFGSGANPQIANTEGPHEIVYDSFGEKIVALTVESESGCLVTKLLNIYVESCCDDFTALEVDGLSGDLNCSYDNDGIIQGLGNQGSPPYQYSLDGVDFQANPNFYNLGIGTYELFIQDKKGCKDSTILTINSPPPLIVNAGRDTTIDLGETIILHATYTPITSIVDVNWTPILGFINCEDCLDPEIKVQGTTSFVIQVTDQNGCIDLDTITVNTKIVRPVVAPNIITLDSYDGNSIFSVTAGPASDYIKRLEIYDRWGSRVYSANNIANGTTYGWNGIFKGKKVDPAVFVWVADVHFIDGVTLTYSGDLTVLR